MVMIAMHYQRPNDPVDVIAGPVWSPVDRLIAKEHGTELNESLRRYKAAEALIRLGRLRLRRLEFARKTAVQEDTVRILVALLERKNREQLREVLDAVIGMEGVSFRAASRVLGDRYGLKVSDKTIADLWRRVLDQLINPDPPERGPGSGARRRRSGEAQSMIGRSHADSVLPPHCRLACRAAKVHVAAQAGSGESPEFLARNLAENISGDPPSAGESNGPRPAPDSVGLLLVLLAERLFEIRAARGLERARRGSRQ